MNSTKETDMSRFTMESRKYLSFFSTQMKKDLPFLTEESPSKLTE